MRTKHILCVTVALLLAAPVFSAQAAAVLVDCTKKGTTLTAALAKLTKSAANTVTISGTCTEDVSVVGYTGLTLIGNPGAAITGTLTPSAGTTLTVDGGSTITVQSLTINNGPSEGATGAMCTGRSLCVFDNVVIQGSGAPSQTGLSLQNQSSADVLGATLIKNNDTGLGVFGASTVNMRPDTFGVAGPVIAGNSSFGAIVQDGSFLRTDDVRITGNFVGVFVQRGAVIKILDENGFGSVDNNASDGIMVLASSAQVGVAVTNNGGNGVFLRQLAFAQVNDGFNLSGNAGGFEVKCLDPVTSVSQGVACGTPSP
jgi:hypothetical protein